MTARIEEWSEVEYHNDPDGPRLSASIATLMLNKTEKHAFTAHPKLGGKAFESSAVMDFGSVVHALVLGTGAKYEVVGGFDDWRKKDAKEKRKAAESAGKIALLAKDHDRAETVAEKLRTRIMEAGFSLGPTSEVPITWEEESTSGPVRCRCLVDNLTLEDHSFQIIDLKTSFSADPEKIAGSMVQNGSDIQYAANMSAVHKLRPDLYGRGRMLFIYAETSEPFCVTPAEPDGEMRALAQARWERAVDKWGSCLKYGKWNEYTDGIARISPRPWDLAKEMGQDDDE